ncbi:hypothetical protein PSU4_30450 [Pseudonocardia sulfidoxydans NBRC 16205]|uniref:Glycosyltransferase RgtA/B/C/D-like domain-containing protein n=1 Tax=Pseudonocardia sulfidoxydans NBRC 16205 TaxID=1223511 RepID=A0A511DH30_9PSEU|nr:hypothetical protein [Pseudonocardia sulfidoxydans]GEL24091.1 hypothetical protein PSU4_30450 [Pseudonocardia sulfidoxydans NBRC 16205]
MATVTGAGVAVGPGAVVPEGNRSRWRRRVRGALVGLAAGGLVLLGRVTGLLDGGPGLLVTMVVLLLIPTSREFSRRVLLTGCVLVGWLPALWWIDLRFDGLGRMTVALAATVAVLGAWVAAGEDSRARARALLPRFRIVDVYPALAVGLGCVVLAPWLQVKTPTQTLGMLMLSWDNSAHFSMFHMIRSTGVTVDMLPPPAGGGTWQFASYPQGFHTLVAAIVEIIDGPQVASVGGELLSYTRGVALLVIAATALLVAGLCALPVLRRRPLVTLPLATLVAAVFLLGPGALSFYDGFGNFVLACAMVVAVALVAIPMPRAFMPVHVLGLAGAVVGVAQGWALLGVLAAPAALAALLPLRRSRFRARPLPLLACLLILAAAVGCLVRTLVVLSAVAVENPLVLAGGASEPDYPLTIGVTAAAILLAIVAHRATRRAERPRLVALVGTPLAGVACSVVLIVMQLDASGSITYYGFKFMTAVSIVAVCLVAIPLAHFGRRITRRRWLIVPGAALSLTLAAASTQAFGWTFATIPQGPTAGLETSAPAGLVSREQEIRLIAAPPSTADLATLVPAGVPEVPGTLVFLDVTDGYPIDPVMAAQWFFSLTDTWTTEGNTIAGDIQLRGRSPEAWAGVAERLLRTGDDVYLAVRTQEAAQLREMLPGRLANRVVNL